MLDLKKLRKDCIKTIHSHSAEFLQECIDSYNRSIALADSAIQPAVKPRMAVGKLNGAAVSAARKPTAAKSAPRTTKVKAKKTKVYA